MKNRLLHPCQIITLRDYPVHNEHILRIYFRIFMKNQGKILPPCPVIHKSLGIPYVDGQDLKSTQYNKLLKKFLEDHPRAEYFLIDGSHKTTAATLSHKLIPVVVLEHNKDFKEAKKRIKTGEFFGWYSVDNSITEAMKVLAKHHFGTKEFLTAEDKTKKWSRIMIYQNIWFLFLKSISDKKPPKINNNHFYSHSLPQHPLQPHHLGKITFLTHQLRIRPLLHHFAIIHYDYQIC